LGNTQTNNNTNQNNGNYDYEDRDQDFFHFCISLKPQDLKIFLRPFILSD
jgi:hypothetical protein